MKAEPERYWRAKELAEAVLILDKQPDTPISKYHTNNIGIYFVFKHLITFKLDFVISEGGKIQCQKL